MDLTDKGRQSITGKHNLADQEKRVKIKELDLEAWTAFATKVKAHEKTQMRIGAIAHTAIKEKRRKALITSLGWSTSTPKEMV